MPRWKLIVAFFFGLAVCDWAIAAPVTIMSLGDSITEGYDNTPNSNGGYRPILYNELASQGIQVQYQGVYDDGSSPYLTSLGQGMQSGFSGFSSLDMYANLDGSVHSQNSPNSNEGGYWMTGGNGTGRSSINPNIVLLLAGANDWNYSSETETYMPDILEWFKANRPSTEVIVASTPPEWEDNGALTAATEADTAYLQTYVAANDPQDLVVNIPAAFLNPDGSVNENLIPDDSVHPNDAGYQVIANVFDAAIVASVPEPSSLLPLVACGLIIRRRKKLPLSARQRSLFYPPIPATHAPYSGLIGLALTSSGEA